MTPPASQIGPHRVTGAAMFPEDALRAAIFDRAYDPTVTPDERERFRSSFLLVDPEGPVVAREHLARFLSVQPRAFKATDPDASDAEREPATGERTRARFISGPEFMAAAAAEPEVLVPRVVFEGCVSTPHGRPRAFKSLATMAGCVEVAAGLPWWGLYRPPRALRVGLVLEEDGDRLLRRRLDWIRAGLELDRLPDGLRLMVRAGLYLEAPSERREFLEHVVRPERLDVLLIDPTRSPFPGVDGGPKDGDPLRRFVREALDVAKAIMLVHHDTKPARDGQDGRARAEQASGGQILSVSDVPMGFTRLSPRSALVEWSLVKVGPDGDPVRLDVESGAAPDGGFADYLRIAARPAAEEDGRDAETRSKVREWVIRNPWQTATDAATGTNLKRETVDRLLAQLAAIRLIRMETGAGAKALGRNPNARLWGPFNG